MCVILQGEPLDTTLVQELAHMPVYFVPGSLISILNTCRNHFVITFYG